MNDEELYGLTLNQHKALERLDRAGRVTLRGQSNVQTEKKRYPPPIRVIAMTDRTYDSTVSELLPIFVYDRDRIVYTVEQVGSALAGYLALTVNGQRFVVECRIDSLEVVEVAVPGLRATVLPGLWEFDFGGNESSLGLEAEVICEGITNEENQTLCELFDDLETAIYNGSTIIRQEFWVTSEDEADPDSDSGALPIAYRDVTDCIPFSSGTIGKGAIGIATWSWDAGYLCIAWQCRNFSHTSPTGACTFRWTEIVPYSEVYEWLLIVNSCSGGSVPEPPSYDGTIANELAAGSCRLPEL